MWTSRGPRPRGLELPRLATCRGSWDTAGSQRPPHDRHGHSHEHHQRGQPDHRAGDGFEPPKSWWTPSISPGGLLIYSGDRFKGWKGDALVPALSGQSLIRVDIDGDKAKKADQWDMGARIRAADQGGDGAVYLLVD